jgi:hypothetical protein
MVNGSQESLLSCWLTNEWPSSVCPPTPNTKAYQSAAFMLELESAINLQTRETLLRVLQNFVRQMVTQKSFLTRRQKARAWYKMGFGYEQAQSDSAAFQCYELCSQELPIRDNTAWLALHARWAPIADELGFEMQATRSYNAIITLLQRRAQATHLVHLATEDNPLFLQALKHRRMNNYPYNQA